MVITLQVCVGIVCLGQVPFDLQEFNNPRVPDLIAVRIVGQSTDTLKPCQSFTVVFEATGAEPASPMGWRKAVRQASQVVRINGREYKNPITDGGAANYACSYELLWPEPIPGEVRAKSAHIALIAAICQVDAKQRTCLFQEPGDHRLEFFFAEHTVEATVRAALPTAAERRITERLTTIPMVLLLLDPTDFQYATPQNIAELEALLDPPSDYSPTLSMTAGVAKGRRVGKPMWSELTDEQKREELQERYRLLEPVAKVERLTTKLEGLAASELAKVAFELGRLAGETPKRVEYEDLTARLFQKVADCPLVPREQALAKQAIQARVGHGE